jgi:hypothetical protein
MEFLMPKRMIRFCTAALFALLFLPVSSCTSLVEFAGRKLSGGPYRGGITVDAAAGRLYYSQAFYQGWMEFTAEYLDGEGIITIAEGALKRDDTLIKGSEALGILKNRLDRIQALTDWMKRSGYSRQFANRQDFDEHWRPILLPETVPPKKRPVLFTTEDAVYTRTEGRRWNTAYTARLFPIADHPLNAELARMRDSGALLRDFDEAAPWIYLQYTGQP